MLKQSSGYDEENVFMVKRLELLLVLMLTKANILTSVFKFDCESEYNMINKVHFRVKWKLLPIPGWGYPGLAILPLRNLLANCNTNTVVIFGEV
jgi:hypothetical protein